jgi:hypothetical protein
MFLRKVDNEVQDTASQKTKVDPFTAVRISDLSVEGTS